jgi:D-sedoheptulose 7-phosphate isomerase
MTHTSQFLQEVQEIARTLPEAQIESLVGELKALRDRGGRLFLIGLGGSAANCSHAVNDFRRLCGIDASSPVDNSSELTAAANDQGWDKALLNPFLKAGDALFVFSVGGGTAHTSFGLVKAITQAKEKKCRVFGVVGRSDGWTACYADIAVVIPTVSAERITPHTEAFQMVILHLLVSHPDLQVRATKW